MASNGNMYIYILDFPFSSFFFFTISIYRPFVWLVCRNQLIEVERRKICVQLHFTILLFVECK